MYQSEVVALAGIACVFCFTKFGRVVALLFIQMTNTTG